MHAKLQTQSADALREIDLLSTLQYNTYDLFMHFLFSIIYILSHNQNSARKDLSMHFLLIPVVMHFFGLF
jgi:hypothetical protein